MSWDKFNLIAEKLTNEIIEGIQNDDLKFEKMWNPLNAPTNYASKTSYKGFNAFYLSYVAQKMNYKTPLFVSFKQALDLKGNVKKGEKGRVVVYWKISSYGKKSSEESSEISSEKNKSGMIFTPFTWTVFNIDQCEGIDFKIGDLTRPFTGIEACEKVLNEFVGAPIFHGGDRASYSPSADRIKMPIQESFKTDESYYSVLFHEMVHSTGHKSRLNRFDTQDIAEFGSVDYSKEELIAEIGSSFLNAWTGIKDENFKNSLAYMKGWIKPLKDDPKMIIYAAQKAHQAAKLILNIEDEKE